MDGLLTPKAVADRISRSTGVTVTARTVWERARAMGLGKKVGRTPLVHIDDVPKILEFPRREPPPEPNKNSKTLAALRRARRLAARK
ncbi:winged helix-turn-helix domain-containing protein [Affinirhizobium pseudoryzae]|uniref:winged helix-turn-helix domain-containing protein n=1 Tax=Allorhizobium pseudoryzae TaxID=379684 RepID=UPI0013EC6A96|nr:winged helix-turn-helix domain-containing protein [Allorhizobium pseudoryzae]